MSEDHKIQKFQVKGRITKSKKQVQRHIGFVNDYRNNFSRLSEKFLDSASFEKNARKTNIRATKQLQSDQRIASKACGLPLK